MPLDHPARSGTGFASSPPGRAPSQLEHPPPAGASLTRLDDLDHPETSAHSTLGRRCGGSGRLSSTSHRDAPVTQSTSRSIVFGPRQRISQSPIGLDDLGEAPRATGLHGMGCVGMERASTASKRSTDGGLVGIRMDTDD